MYNPKVGQASSAGREGEGYPSKWFRVRAVTPGEGTERYSSEGRQKKGKGTKGLWG